MLLLSEPGGDDLFFKDLGPVDEAIRIWKQLEPDKSSRESRRHASELYGRLVGLFDDKIKDVKILYIAPDDLLSQIPFSRLLLPDGRYWAERQELRYLQTGRDLVR